MIRTLAPALLALALGACATNPTTGREQFTGLMSPAAERQTGAEQHPEILKEFGGAVRDPAPSGYVAEVGSRLTRNSEMPGLNFTFTLLDTEVINAFALPGGYVYVTRGLLAILNSEAELAGVLGHEIGHVTARHSAERYSQSVVVGLGAALLGAAIGSETGSQLLNVGAAAWLTSHSREQEFEADGLGVRYLGRNGYNPRGMAIALAALQREDALDRTLRGKADGGGLDFFATHPNTPDRVQRALGLAGANDSGVIGQQSYYAAVNGLAFGGTAEQGLVRDQAFIHPDLGFVFEAPAGFDLRNAPTQVVASAGDGSLAVFDIDQSRRADMLAYIAQDWAKGAALANVERLQLAGRPAATAMARISRNGGAADVRLVAVHWGGDRIFRFLFLTDPARTAGHERDFLAMTRSLRPLSPADRQRWRPWQLRVITVPAGATVESLAQGSPLGAQAPAWLRMINGLDGRQNPTAGQQFKLVVNAP